VNRERALLTAGLLGAVAWFPGAGARATAGAPEVFDVAADAAPVMSVGAFPAAVPLVLSTAVARSSVIINSQPRAQSQAAIIYSPAAETASVVGVPEHPPRRGRGATPTSRSNRPRPPAAGPSTTAAPSGSPPGGGTPPQAAMLPIPGPCARRRPHCWPASRRAMS
jgi:hypothetical protein